MVGLEDLLNKRCKKQFYDWFRGLTAHQVDSGFEARTYTQCRFENAVSPVAEWIERQHSPSQGPGFKT